MHGLEPYLALLLFVYRHTKHIGKRNSCNKHNWQYVGNLLQMHASPLAAISLRQSIILALEDVEAHLSTNSRLDVHNTIPIAL